MVERGWVYEMENRLSETQIACLLKYFILKILIVNHYYSL